PAARGRAQPELNGTPNAREDPARMTNPLFRPPAPPMFQQGRRGRRLVIAFAVCLALWTVALLVPVPHKAAEAVLGSPSRMFYVGKALQVSAYALLTAFAGTLVLCRRTRAVVLALLVLHGGMTEFFQQFVDRGASWRDWGLDCVGILIGLGLAW